MASKSDNAENGSTAAAPEGTADGGGYASLSTRDQEILAKAMTCLKAQPEIDFQQLANELGMKNHRSAINAWGQIKKKMGWNKVPASPSGGKAPAAGSKRKMAILKEDEADGDEADAAPAKRAKVDPKQVAPKSRKRATATPKKGKAAAAAESPAAAKEESEEEKASSEDKAETKAGIKEESQVDGEV